MGTRVIIIHVTDILTKQMHVSSHKYMYSEQEAGSSSIPLTIIILIKSVHRGTLYLLFFATLQTAYSLSIISLSAYKKGFSWGTTDKP